MEIISSYRLPLDNPSNPSNPDNPDISQVQEVVESLALKERLEKVLTLLKKDLRVKQIQREIHRR